MQLRLVRFLLQRTIPRSEFSKSSNNIKIVDCDWNEDIQPDLWKKARFNLELNCMELQFLALARPLVKGKERNFWYLKQFCELKGYPNWKVCFGIKWVWIHGGTKFQRIVLLVRHIGLPYASTIHHYFTTEICFTDKKMSTELEDIQFLLLGETPSENQLQLYFSAVSI